MRIVAVLALLAAGLGTASGQGSIDPESGSRLPLLTREDMDDEASARIYAALAGPDGAPRRGSIGIRSIAR